MLAQTQKHRQSKSSNQESFQALNQVNERVSHNERKSIPSQSSDFDGMNDKRLSTEEIIQKKEQYVIDLNEELDTLEKMIVSNQKSVQEQLQMIKLQYKEKQKEVFRLQNEITNLKKKTQELEQNVSFYRQQNEKFDRKFKQQSNVSNSLSKKTELEEEKQNFIQKDFTKKKTESVIVTLLQQQLEEKLREKQVQIHSMNQKVNLYMQHDKKIRDFLGKYLKFNPSFTMQLPVLVQSAVIQLDSNLKQLNRQLQNTILNFHLQSSNKITQKRQKIQQEVYNHWQTLSNLDAVRDYLQYQYRKA